jgi:hypothetical protein
LGRTPTWFSIGTLPGFAVKRARWSGLRVAPSTRITYNFDYIGEAVLDGQSCYILALKPKRKETDLISGEVWMATFTWNKGATLPTTSLEASMESPADVVTSSAINTDNYNFDYIGEAVLDGQSCYILALKPKRKETDLISGEVWMATFTWNKGATLPTTSLEASMESPADVISFPATGRKAPSRRDASFHRPVETCHLPLWKRSPKLRS